MIRNFYNYFLIFTLSIIIGFYSFEFYLHYKAYKDYISSRKYFNNNLDKFKEYKLKTGKNYDKRSKIEFFLDLKKQDPDFVVNVNPIINVKNNMELYPLSGISNSKTIHCNENGYYSIYKSDRYGFNNPDNYWEEDIDYFFVGDSFLHGACVNRPYDVASILRDKYNKKALNLSYSGNGPLTQYATLREYLPKNVKNIYWSVFKNDFSELKDELKSPILLKYLTNPYFSQNLNKRQIEIDNQNLKNIDKALKLSKVELNKKKEQKIDNYNFKDHFKINHFLKFYKLRYDFLIQKKLDQDINKKFIEILILAKKMAKENGSTFNIIYIPSYFKFTTSYEDLFYFNLKKDLKKLEINMIDLYEVFKNRRNLDFFPFGFYGHYNELGYKIIADEIYQFSK